MNYSQFLHQKTITAIPTGIEPAEPHPTLFDFQRDVVKWALRLGRACIWEDCGLGKTFQECEWARQIPGNVLMLAPLAVVGQTVGEAAKLGLEVRHCRHGDQVQPGITITNYEMLEHFDAAQFAGVVLDESSILKNYTGKYRSMLIAKFSDTRFKLAATATPAPNDYMELGSHAEFVGAMDRSQMLARFFVHDGGETQKWRLKGHAQSEFWRWVCSWAIMMRKPSDLGYEDGAFILPPLNINQVTVDAGKCLDGFLFPLPASTLNERRIARRDSITERVKACADLIRKTREAHLIWCNLNQEQDDLAKLLGDDCLSIYGAMSNDEKQDTLTRWLNGDKPWLVSKPSIIGYGINAQHCSNISFLGLSDSWEDYYQAIRRCWRFGQLKPVQCNIITSEAEGVVVKNIQRKEADATRLVESIVEQMRDLNREQVHGTRRTITQYHNPTIQLPNWLHNGNQNSCSAN